MGKVDNILDTTIENLESLRIVFNNNMPPTISQIAPLFNNPSNNSAYKRQKTKRNYTYSIYHKPGHNIHNCH